MWRFLWWLDGVLDYLPTGIDRNANGRPVITQCLGCELRMRWPWLDRRMLQWIAEEHP